MEPCLSLLVVRTGRMDETLSLYRTLGLSFSQEQHGTGPVHYSCKIGPTVLEIYPQKAGEKIDATTRIGFQIASLDQTFSQLQNMGIEVITPLQNSEWGRRAVIADLDGRKIELTQSN